MAKSSAVQPWEETYIVESQINGEWVEELHYGLSHLQALLEEKFGKIESAEAFYEDILTPAVQRILSRRVRVATAEDLKNHEDVAIIKKKAQSWVFWSVDEEKRKNALAVEITEWLQQNVDSLDDLKLFMNRTGLNTSQVRAIARRGYQSKDKFPETPNLELSEDFVEFYSEFVADKSIGKNKTTAEAVRSKFYGDLV